jgi:hypothetical protein
MDDTINNEFKSGIYHEKGPQERLLKHPPKLG